MNTPSSKTKPVKLISSKELKKLKTPKLGAETTHAKLIQQDLLTKQDKKLLHDLGHLISVLKDPDSQTAINQKGMKKEMRKKFADQFRKMANKSTTLAVANLDNFDPVFRKCDYQGVKKNVVQMLKLDQKYGADAKKQWKQDAMKRKQSFKSIVDLDTVEFKEMAKREK